MKKIVLLLVALIVAAGTSVAMAKDYEIKKKTGDLTVTVRIDRNPPVTGMNKLDMFIKDEAGKDVTNATVAINYGMPPMPGMGAMNYKTTATLKNTSYQGSLNFSMAGPWYINIKISRGNSIQTVKLNVDIK